MTTTDRPALLHEHDLPIVVSQGDQLLIVVDVEERLPWAVCYFSRQVRNKVVPIEMDLVRRAVARSAEKLWTSYFS
jgi:hypothetical protein